MTLLASTVLGPKPSWHRDQIDLHIFEESQCGSTGSAIENTATLRYLESVGDRPLKKLTACKLARRRFGRQAMGSPDPKPDFSDLLAVLEV